MNTSEQYIINGKEVDIQTLEIEGVEMFDYPDFCDAFVCYGEFMDGTKMSDDDLDEFCDSYGCTVHEMAHESLH